MLAVEFDEVYRVMLLHPVVHHREVHNDIVNDQVGNIALSFLLILRRAPDCYNFIENALSRDIVFSRLGERKLDVLVVNTPIQLPVLDTLQKVPRRFKFLCLCVNIVSS